MNNSELEQFLAPYSAEIRKLVMATRHLIVAVMPDAIEQFDEPARLIGYGFDRTYAGLVCGIAIHKAHVNLMFSRGIQLPDPANILDGTGKYARHVRIRSLRDTEQPSMKELLEAALQHYFDQRKI